MVKHITKIYVILFLIFFFALLLRLTILYILSTTAINADAIQYNEIAMSIAEGKGYAMKNGEPTAIRPPLYPFFLAGIYVFIGNNIKIVQILQSCLLALVCIIIFYIGKNIFDLKTGYIASGVAAVYPMLIYPSYQLLSESLLIFLFSLSLLFVLKSRDNQYFAILAGFLLSLSVLTKPTVLFTLPFFIIWIFREHVTQKRLAHTSTFFIAFLMVFIPWTVRNYLIFHDFVPVSTSGGVAFFDSHVLPVRGLGFSNQDQIPEWFDSIKNEASRNRFLTQHTLEYIINHPQKILSQTVLKVVMFFYPLDGYWYPFSMGSRYNPFWATIFLFSLAGIFYANRKASGVQLLLWTMLSFFMTIIVFQGIPRYRLVLEPVFILFAASGLTYMCLHQRFRMIVGILGFNVIMFLFFRYFEFHNLISWEEIKLLM